MVKRLIQGDITCFARSNPDGSFHGEDDDLAVANLAGLGCRLDRLDHASKGGICYHGGDHCLREQPGFHLDAPVDLGVTHLLAEALNGGDCHAVDAEAHKSILDGIKLFGADDGLDLFHVVRESLDDF